MQLRWARFAYALVLLAGLGWIFVGADRSGASAPGRTYASQKGFAAPDFTLKTGDGTSVTLSSFRGRAVLINLWATWCGPCRAEMPNIEKTYRDYRDRGLVVLGVNSTFQDDPLAVAAFVQEFGLSFPILLDESGQVARLYKLRLLPTSFFIDRDGLIQEVVVGGPMPEALLRVRIEEILK